MNANIKRRLVVVTGLIVVVLVVVLAIVGAATASKTVTVSEALRSEMRGVRVQVTGKVVDNSYQTVGDVLTFAIYDDEGGELKQLAVRYDGGVAATFGNQVTAICTGTINEEGVLACTELVTKCPSKYENATDALSVSQLLSYNSSITGKPLKVTGIAKPGTLKPAGQGQRLVLLDANGVDEVSVIYSGAIPDAVTENSSLVVTGSLNSSGAVEATDISLKG